MFKRFLHFIKYNNMTVLIALAVFVFGTGVFAQTETGQQVIGAKESVIEGVDNTLLLEADLDNLAMDYMIEKIEEDDSYYYITYTFIDLIKVNSAWQYQMQEKLRKVSKNIDEDLGIYLSEELTEEYEARIKELKDEQAKAKEEGEQKRVEVVAYTGLIGQTLELASKAFPGYEPIKKRELPVPNFTPNIIENSNSSQTRADDLTQIYLDYINENDPDNDNIFGTLDNCPNVANPDQLDSNEDGIGDACETNTPSTPNATSTPNAPDETKATSTPSEQTDETINTEEPAVESPAEDLTNPEEVDTSEPAGEPETVNNDIPVEQPTEEPDVEIIELP